MTINAQDKALQDAMATLTRESEAVSKRHPDTHIVAGGSTWGRGTEVVSAPTTGYRVTVAGLDIDVEATDHGDAVVKALTMDTTPPEVGGYVFLFRYMVTDSTGMTFDGGDRVMRDLLEAARIRAKARR